MLLSMVPLYLLGHNDQNEVKHDSLYMWCYWQQFWHTWCQWHWNDIILFLGSKLLQPGCVMPLALLLVSHDADGIINSTIPFLMSKWLKLGAAWPFAHVLPLALIYALCDADGTVNSTIAFVKPKWLKVMSCHWHCCWHHMMPSAWSKEPIHYLYQDNQNEEQHDIFESCDSCNCHWHHMTPLVLMSNDATAISARIKWCLWHHKWHHYIFRSRW